MLKYISTHKLEIIILSILLIVLNIYKICFQIIGVDTEQALFSLDSNLNWTLGSGRFASAILRKILMPYGFNYYFAILITLVGWLCVCLLYQYCVCKFGKLNRWCGLLFSAIMVSNPIWAEQNYFTCSVFVNVIGILLTVFVAYLITKYFQCCTRKIYIMGAMCLIILSLGIYQALLYLIIANTIIFLSLSAYTNNLGFREYFLSGIKSLLLIIVATCIYFIVSKTCVALFYNSEMDYVGFLYPSLYVSGLIKWFQVDFVQCLNMIWKYICESLSPANIYGSSSLVFIWCILQIYLIIFTVWKKEIKNLLIIVGNILLLMAVYLGTFILGGSIRIREQVVLPIAIAFMLSYFINDIMNRISNESKIKYVFRWAISIMCVYSVLVLGSKQLLINRSDYVRYMYDVNYASNIMNELEELCDYSTKKIVFIGKNNWELPSNYYIGDAIGYSIFSWDYNGPVGVNYRVYAFLNALGYNYEKPTIEEIQVIRNLYGTEIHMNESERITLIDDFIVVNLDRF